MATNMDLVSITTAFLVLFLCSFDSGNAGIIRRDVPPIAIPVNVEKPQTNYTKDNSTQANSTLTDNGKDIPMKVEEPTTSQSNSTQANNTQSDYAKAKNCSIEVVAFIPFTEKTNFNETVNSGPEKTVHDSYPNPPVPTPPSPTVITTTKATEKTSEPELNDDGTKKWGFDDKYLASQNKYATRRNVVFDVVAGDAMSFSNYNVLGHQEVTLQRKK